MKSDLKIELKSNDFLMYKSYAKKSLSWLTDHLENFSPIQKNVASFDGLKLFTELILLYTHIKKWKQLDLEAELSKWDPFIKDHLENKIFAENSRKRPETSYAYIFPYLLLRSIGYKSEYYEDSYRYMIHWGHYESIELAPFRQLDLEYFLWGSGLQKKEPNWKTLFNSTTLGRSRTPLTLLDENPAYSVTHTLFYLTDFGNQSLSLPQKKIKEIIKTLELLLLHYWRIGNYDLMGELLINLTCLNENQSYIYQNALKVFLSAWNKDGAIPASKNNKNELNDFGFCYHTTLVGVLLCSIKMNKIIERENL